MWVVAAPDEIPVVHHVHRRAREEARCQRLAGRRLLDDDIGRLEERFDAACAARAVYRRVARLPEPERAVPELVAVDGLAVSEAAAALGIRSGTARVRLFRARRALRNAHDEFVPLNHRPMRTS